MNKIKTSINIYAYSFLIFVLLQLPCHAIETKNRRYIEFALKSFFNLRDSSIDNQVYSPLGVNSCISAFNLILEGQEKIELETEIQNKGITIQKLFDSGDNIDNLQFFTTMLTRYETPQVEKDRIKQAKIILGEYLLNADNNQQEEARRNEFKQKIEDILQQKFKWQQNLDYKQLWSNEDRLAIYLKIISVLRFQAKWLDGKFKKIGKDKFTSFDNKELTVDYMKNKIKGIINYNNVSQWKSVRIFYENNYVLDIFIPQTKTEYNSTSKSGIIADLIEKSNTQNYKYDINLKIPLFKFKKKSAITSMLKKMISSFKNKDIELEQECIIKVDEEGTIAEAITTMCANSSYIQPREIIIDSSFYYMISKVEEIKNSDHSGYEIKNIIIIGAVNNPLLEK